MPLAAAPEEEGYSLQDGGFESRTVGAVQVVGEYPYHGDPGPPARVAGGGESAGLHLEGFCRSVAWTL